MMIIHWFKRRKDRRAISDALYQVALAQSRRPEFYENLGVPDTMDGRFDLLSLHIFLMIDRLNDFGKDGHKQGQSLFDSMFTRMELDLREMGIGDLGVPKHMAKMMKAFNGRAHVYQPALKSLDIPALETAITRNIFRQEKQDASQTVLGNVAALTDYTVRMNAMLKDLSFDDLKTASVSYPHILSQDEAQKRSA